METDKVEIASDKNRLSAQCSVEVDCLLRQTEPRPILLTTTGLRQHMFSISSTNYFAALTKFAKLQLFCQFSQKPLVSIQSDDQPASQREEIVDLKL